ncbi:DUF1801 domain-containing protein [Candidatus Saccharibacteria bacterium]|nr:DUF1801 domain-containing protein [Candidatus Saccharibacteria bacterium]
MRVYKAKTVDDYIASSPKPAQPKLSELRALIRSTVPKTEEKIAWGVPFYRYHGALGGYATFTNHVSFGFTEILDLSKEERNELAEKGYKVGKKTIQIQFDQSIPADIIKRILKTRVAKNESAAKAKLARKARGEKP